MPLTKSFTNLVQDRAAHDPEFAASLQREGVDTIPAPLSLRGALRLIWLAAKYPILGNGDVQIAGTASRLGVRRRSPSAAMNRLLAGISVRRRNRTYHYRRHNEPGAGGPRRVVTSASVGIYSFGGSPGNWPSLR